MELSPQAELSNTEPTRRRRTPPVKVMCADSQIWCTSSLAQNWTTGYVQEDELSGQILIRQAATSFTLKWHIRKSLHFADLAGHLKVGCDVLTNTDNSAYVCTSNCCGTLIPLKVSHHGRTCIHFSTPTVLVIWRSSP